MIFTYETIWEPCTKEEYEREAHKLFGKCRRVPIYHNVSCGILEHIKLWGKEPDEWRYEKAIGKKQIILLSTSEAEDKELMTYLREVYNIMEDEK